MSWWMNNQIMLLLLRTLYSLELQIWKGFIRCAYFYLKNSVCFLNINGPQIWFLPLVLRGMISCCEFEVPFNLLGRRLLSLGVWKISRVFFVLLFILLQFYLIFIMQCHWVRQEWWNRFLLHRRLSIPLFTWVLWFIFIDLLDIDGSLRNLCFCIP